MYKLYRWQSNPGIKYYLYLLHEEGYHKNYFLIISADKTHYDFLDS